MTILSTASISSAFGFPNEFISREIVLGHSTPTQCKQSWERQVSFKRPKCLDLGLPQVIFCVSIRVSSAGSAVHPWRNACCGEMSRLSLTPSLPQAWLTTGCDARGPAQKDLVLVPGNKS